MSAPTANPKTTSKAKTHGSGSAPRLVMRRRKRKERCPACGGCGETIGWVAAVDDVDWVVCGMCNGDGYVSA